MLNYMKILKFGAIWCMECLVMRPMWAEIESETPELKTEYYDIDEHPGLVKKYNAKNIPIFIFLDKNSEEFLRLQGYQKKDDLIKIIKENLNR